MSGQTYVRHDGGSDDAVLHCNNTGTSTAPDANPNDDDLDNNDGGSRRQGNEPFSVIDPTDPQTVVAGWNDYCQTDLGDGWQGFAYSRDGGETWVDSFVPGYPEDTSAEGQASPLFGTHTDAGDPIGAFDNDGNLFVGGISFNRADAINGHVYVAKYTSGDVVIPGLTPDYPVNYKHTRVVGIGTPSRNFFGIFQDKPMLEVDRTDEASEGNVYVCWSRFTGFGQNKIYLSRSTDNGESFSRPIQLTTHGFSGSVQGCDIAIEGDGDLYVTFRTFNDASVPGANALFFVRSTDAGASFSRPKKIQDITPYNPLDGSRDCGDGAELCPTGFVFARVPLEPRSTADQNATTDGVYLVYNAVDPATIVPNPANSYNSAGPGKVGRSVVYVVASTDDGATWSSPVKVDNAGGVGHQFFPDIDALNGTLAVVWQDSRTDDCWSVQRPMGNTASATACASDDVVNTFVASASASDLSTWSSIKVSDVGHQPQYEMFGNRQVPFQGDYNWVSIVDDGGDLEAYVTWTDNRNVVPGTDPRETVQDGFDVLQCRVLGTDGVTYGADQCANAGGVDQNIYGNRLSIP
ncbi:MAG: sialidase family protein [Chloroflexota bacterium]